MSKLMPEKKKLIDFACTQLGVKSFIDLGGVWGVDGGYTFYILEKYKIDKAMLVDTNISEIVIEKQKSFPHLSLIKTDFGSDNVIRKMGKVDAIIMFDVLLHQVAPNWY